MAKIYLNESQLREMIKDIILEYNGHMNTDPMFMQDDVFDYNRMQPVINSYAQQAQQQNTMTSKTAPSQKVNPYANQGNSVYGYQPSPRQPLKGLYQGGYQQAPQQPTGSQTNNQKQQYNWNNKTMNSVSKLPLPIQQMINNPNQWPQNAQAAYKVVNVFQNYPTQGAGWLKNANILATQLNSPQLSQLIKHCRQLINQSANKQNSQRVTNYAYNNPTPPRAQ